VDAAVGPCDPRPIVRIAGIGWETEKVFAIVDVTGRGMSEVSVGLDKPVPFVEGNLDLFS
jgi:hypothetical protein